MAEALLEIFLEVFVSIFGEMASGLIYNNKRNTAFIKAAKIILIVVTISLIMLFFIDIAMICEIEGNTGLGVVFVSLLPIELITILVLFIKSKVKNQ